jgi:hypothetical protein
VRRVVSSDADATRHARPTDADPVPRPFDPQRTIVFPHVPRTGGSTIKNLFRIVYGTERSRLDVHRMDDVDPDELRGMAFVEGHRSVRRQEAVFGEDWVTNGFTLLREPVSRVISQARHIRARPHANPMFEHLRRRAGSPAEVFDAVPALNNLQTRMLAGRGAPPAGRGAAAQLDWAKATLDQTAFGLTESFDASAALLAEHFGIWLPTFSKTNVSKRYGDRDIRTDEFAAEAARRNAVDAELYAYAREVFAARTARYVERLDALDLEAAPLECDLFSGWVPVVDDTIVSGRPRLRLRGSVLVDGHAPDAAYVRVGEVATPIACGIYNRRMGLRNRLWDNLYASVQGRVGLPEGATSLDLVALDRRRGRRAVQTFTLDRRPTSAAAVEGVYLVRQVGQRLRR